MERRNNNCDKCNIKLKGNGAYELHYTGKVYWLCGHCMNGIVKREILTSELENDFVTPICEDDVVEITGKTLLQHRDICRKEGALGELRLFLKWWKENLPDIPEDYIKRRIKELKRVKK